MKPSVLLRSTAIVGAGTALSRLLGFVREMLMAWLFGTSLAKSAFDVAFRIPNLFRRLFGEGALSAAFIPVFTETLKRDGKEEAGLLVSRVASLLAAVLSVIVGVSILVIWGVEQVVPLGERSAAVLPLLRIMLPYTLFICLAALSMGVLNSLGYFAVPALAPVILNLVWTGALIWICPRLGGTPAEQITWLAWSILLAGALQLLAQIPVLRRCGIAVRPHLHWKDVRVQRVLLLMGPAALGLGVYQVNTVIDGVLALFVGSWAPAALTYAERLIYLPLGIIATALGTVLLPAFSQHAAADRHDQIGVTLRHSLRGILLAMTPAAVGLLVLVNPIVRLSYVWGGGKFDALSTLQTSRAVAFYCPGLIVFSIYKVMVPAFYALKDTRNPVRVGLWAVLVNFCLNILFILTWPEGYQHAGLAFATVLASVFNCIVLGRMLQHRIGDPGWRRIGRTGVRALAGSSLMGAAAWYCQRIVEAHLVARGLVDKLSQTISVGVAIALAMAVYLAWLAVTGRADLAMLLQARRRRRG
ncbi:MAG: murein biosynthesis integral membrane protein MurJ [Lentisphaerae bacterium]|nr:murein biosynthesis integral membrane protein MurJ [Lentisphaerota bacterium]